MDSNEQKLTPFHFQSPERPDKEWEDWFREYHARKVMNVEFDPAPDAPLRLGGRMLLLPGAAISDMTITAGISRNNNFSDSDDVFLVAAPSGAVATLYKGDPVTIGEGTVALGRADEAGCLKFSTECNLVTIRLKRRMLEPFVPQLADALTFSYIRETPAMRLLLAYADILMSGQIEGGPELQHAVSTHIHDLAGLALGAGRDGAVAATARGMRGARLAAIKRDALAELGDPSLSASTIAARHGVTPRYVSMLFESEGKTFSEYVLDQRLARAHQFLSDPRFAAETISSIAMFVGFGDLSYFNRTFRRRFAMSPSDVRALARGKR